MARLPARERGLSRPLAANPRVRRDEMQRCFTPSSKLEAAFHKADDSIRNIIQLLEAT